MSEDVSPHMEALTLVIFGATGDLSRKKLLPALFDLYLRGYLPKHFRVVGVSRRPISEADYRGLIRDVLVRDFSDPPESDVRAFLEHFFYCSGTFDEAELYTKLSGYLSELDEKLGSCPQRLFYLAVPPHFYDVIFSRITESGIARAHEEGWTRILVEKPFGHNLETARTLDRKLGSLFTEDQIFRIEHYLAKASLQNILAFRFSNAIFEETWSARHIDRVHLKLYEGSGVEERGEFYDGIGALRDVGQNHMLQMLAMVAMDNPQVQSGEALGIARSAVFEHLRTYSPEQVRAHAVFGQYRGYRDIPGVAPTSTTETYFKVTAFVDNERWNGVPFILESGKKLHKTFAEIDVWFKAPERGVCSSSEVGACQNRVTIGINPTQYVTVRLWGRKSGLHFELEPHDLRFELPALPAVRVPDAYAKVLFDAIAGDRTLFMTTRELEASWKFISPILEEYRESEPVLYAPGSDPNLITM